jgi:uncharacterized damage-inducible protein DinB
MVRTPLTGAEKETLHAFLNKQRDVFVWKLQELDDDALRKPMTPTGTNLLGMLQHLAAVEYDWFCLTFGRETEPLPFDENDESADLRVGPTETTEDIFAFYSRAREAADRVITELDLEATGTSWAGDTVSLRWVLLHMIEETARHAGHADIVRELIDGAAGLRRDVGNMPDGDEDWWSDYRARLEQAAREAGDID